MVSNRFLSYAQHVSKLEKISLGEAQRKFLYIIAKKPISAYDIHLEIKKEIDIKNVRKTVNRLHDLGLIEIEGYYPRNAIRFKLTSYGLFQLLCDGPMPISILDMYQNDIILQNILFDSFELETIRAWINLEAPMLLMQYVNKSCQAILSSIQNSKSLSKQYDLDKNRRFGHLVGFLQTSLSRVLYQFIIEILVTTAHPPKRSDESEALPDLIPKVALARDKKFLALASRVKKPFVEACEYFMI